jgi:hypothetical protein
MQSGLKKIFRQVEVRTSKGEKTFLRVEAVMLEVNENF